MSKSASSAGPKAATESNAKAEAKAAASAGISVRFVVLAAVCPVVAIVFSEQLRSAAAAAVTHPRIISVADSIIEASLPASTSWEAVHVAALVYAMFCYLLPSMIPPGKPGSPRPLSFLLRLTHAAHYAGLSLASLWMLSYMLIITSARVQSSSAAAISPFVPNSASSWLLCERQPAMSNDFYRLSFVYYLSKYWELLDSLFQLQKARSLGSSPPGFLHYFHHAAVMVMCLNWLESNQSLQWLGLAFNTFVHVIMYAYYAFTVYKPAPKPLKKLITQIQIIQFASSLVIFMGTLYHLIVLREPCVGMSSLVYNVVFNVCLLFLFTQFKERAYSETRPTAQ